VIVQPLLEEDFSQAAIRQKTCSMNLGDATVQVKMKAVKVLTVVRAVKYSCKVW
jgi:hypothetical protein